MARSPRAYHLQRTYGITEEQYDDMLRQQNGCCAICDRDAQQFNTRLAVDHNHQTGEVRGLLCNNCNHRVIGRHTDYLLLRRASNYLEGPHTGWFVPPKKRKRRSRTERKK